MKTANAGKHVLVEKPDAVNTTELQAMLDACAANNVQFMDAVMWMHNTRNGPLLEAIESIGPTRRVVSAFTFSGGDAFLASDNIRVRNDGTVRAPATEQSGQVLSCLACKAAEPLLCGQGDPLGSLGDLGWYNTRACLFAMGYQKPLWAAAHGKGNVREHPGDA